MPKILHISFSWGRSRTQYNCDMSWFVQNNFRPTIMTLFFSGSLSPWKYGGLGPERGFGLNTEHSCFLIPSHFIFCPEMGMERHGGEKCPKLRNLMFILWRPESDKNKQTQKQQLTNKTNPQKQKQTQKNNTKNTTTQWRPAMLQPVNKRLDSSGCLGNLDFRSWVSRATVVSTTFYKASPWFMGSPSEDAFRPAKFPRIVSKAPNPGSGGIFAQNARQPGPRCQEWATGHPVLRLPRGSLMTWGQLSVPLHCLIVFIFLGLSSDGWA